jgi:hypothetical protein
MGRQRKTPRPNVRLTVADTPEEAARRMHVLLALSGSTKGRPWRVDRLSTAMQIADQVPPRDARECRRHRGERGRAVAPRREASAAQMLQNVLLAEGEAITEYNATRIIEQSRAILRGEKLRR